MIKVFEKHQQLTNISNYQSRIIECKSFQDYLDNLDETSFPRKDVEIYRKYIDYLNETVTFMFELKQNEKWDEYIHFAQVIK